MITPYQTIALRYIQAAEKLTPAEMPGVG